jgi:hypothetical protein
VHNHAFALLVDGGTYNAASVSGVGLTKAAHIYWRAMSVYQVPISGFVDHADLIELSCQDLVGAVLTDLVTGAPSVETITSVDCHQVALAMAAVEMRTAPTQCDFDQLLDQDPPQLDGYVEVFADSFESDPSSTWTFSNEAGSPSFVTRDWQWVSTVPGDGDGAAVYAVDAPGVVGNCNDASDDQSGVLYLESPPIHLPGGAVDLVLAFDHYVATEQGWDGGNLKASVNGGPFELVSIGSFAYNWYNGVLIRSREGNTNPMAGELAFTGADEGGFSGTWAQSQIDLKRLAQPGDTITLRFDFGVDQCFGADGWYVDNVRVLAKLGDPRRPGGRLGG